MRLLRSAHFRVQAYNSAAAFIDSLATQAPDCLLLDLQMPTMTGVEVQEYLARENAKFPVIIITAYDEPETAQRCMKLGASLFLRKPVEAGLLIKSIRKLVGDGTRAEMP